MALVIDDVRHGDYDVQPQQCRNREASPLTTEKEREVGRELCYMLGYGYDNVTPWGHITCVIDLGIILLYHN